MKKLSILLIWSLIACVPVLSGQEVKKTSLKEETGTLLNDFDKKFKLLPKPQKIEIKKGTGLSYRELEFLTAEKSVAIPVLEKYLQDLPQVKSNGKGILLKLSNSAELPDSKEGYILEVTVNGVIIQARDSKGLFYACQTLEQLLEDSHDQNINIPLLKITDFPEIDYRAIHLDLKHHLDAGNYYYSIIDRLAKIKVNAIIVEFEDKLRYRRAPVVGAAHAISIEEFSAICKYASERNIEISPLVQGLGHASFILKHEEYKSVRDDITSDWVFDPLNPDTYKVQFALYEDAMEATPNGKYLHIGGDEVGDLGKSKLCKESGKTPFELQMYWLKKVTDFAVQHNRIPIFWDDMVFKLSGLYNTTYDGKIGEQQVKELWNKNKSILDKSLPLFPTNCVYNRWNYDQPKLPGNLLAIDWFKENKLNVMAATAAQQMWPMLPRNNSNFQSIKDFCQVTSEKKMNGILCTIWDDSSPHFETVWRGVCDFGLFSWNYHDISKETAHSIYRHRFYAPELESEAFNFQDMLEKGAAFWDNALTSKGYRGKYDETNKMIDLPDLSNNQQWSKKYELKLNAARTAALQYESIKNILTKAAESTRRNRYSLRIFNQINELEGYSSGLLLLLEQFDKAPAEKKKETSLRVRQLVASFPELRRNFDKVYSETRFTLNPPGYQLDSNMHQHLANGTVNTDWMFRYELSINKKIQEWLNQNKL